MAKLAIPIGVALFLALASAHADPPARVGRVSLAEGEVTVDDRTSGGSAEPATLSWPVTSGTALATARGARAEVRIGSTAVRLDGATELEFVHLDDEATQLRLEHGTINVRVRDQETAVRFTVDTLDARVVLAGPGRYRFDVNPRAGTTTVTAFQGAAQLTVGGATITVPPGRRAEIGPQGRIEVVGVFADGFDDWALARDRGDDLARSTRYVSPEMTGQEALDEYGDWRETAEYGAVWYPRAVPVGWAPYRFGRWGWVAPWGWTWVDAAPWGFAPFHYGRWALIGGAWGWAPGAFVARPVYAPALVGWIGQPGWSISVSVGAVSAVGWFPLAPREVFVPAYRCSTVYVSKINVTHVTNVVNVAHPSRPQFAHRHVDRAVTVVPASTMTTGQPVGRALLHARQTDLPSGASNAPPEAVAKPAHRWFEGARARDDERGPRRPPELARPAPSQPARGPGVAIPPPQGDRGPIADRSPPRDERDGRGPRMPERPDARTVTRSIERPAALPQPSPGIATPPQSGRGPIADRSPPREEQDRRGPPPDPRTVTRSIERPAPLPQSSAGVAMTPPAPDRTVELPSRLERRPEATRIERPVDQARVPAPRPEGPARQAVPEPRRGAPPQPATLPQLSFPGPAAERGEARSERGGRGEARGGEGRGREPR